MDAPLQRLRCAAAALRLDLLPPEGVVAEAAKLVNELPTNRSLAELAGATATTEVVTDLLSRALEEEVSSLPSDREAGRIVAREVCRAIVRADVSPVEGARTIWWKVVRRVPELERELGHFVGLASEWEDDSAHRAQYEDDIRRAAAALAEGA